ncbi:MAG: hypothetical protein QOI31_1256 [Solirubrobacterales bacterium]|jgi:hypothetical protein|nr:hypothetical protein [Solirubrobacterales bacterium]
MGRSIYSCVVALALAAFLPAVAEAQVRAGAASVDASWHVGASAGQYAGDCVLEPEVGCASVDPTSGNFDPTVHAYRRRPSYGIQSRLSARAIVIEGPDGHRVAIVKNDLYIPQDLVYRRASQILETEGDCGITEQTLTMVSSHNHSSPFYSSTSWGAWAFQDVFDVRFFEYMAERMAQAVEEACDQLVPVRVGAARGVFDKTHRHSFGPAIADDGTPAGYPYSDTDKGLSVIRFDDVSNPDDPKPVANLVSWSGHPEFLEGNDLISADYVGSLERMLDRESEATTIFMQRSVGTAEPERSTFHSVHERLEFSHRDYAQAEYGARLLADAVLALRDDVAQGQTPNGGTLVPFATDFPVESDDRWFPGPFSHPYPGVSNCRMDKGLAGNPQLPVVGLPDCQGVLGGLGDLSDILGLPAPPDDGLPGIDPGLSTDDFQALGIPVPENYAAPGYTGLEEDIDVHLQALRLGDIVLTMCSCEQWYDQAQNIVTRTDRVADNEYLGYDWSAQCDPVGDGTYQPDGSGTGTWLCPNPHNPATDLPPVTDLEMKRFAAQVLNPANGWNNAENAATAESEPTDPREIKGNYTHDDRCGLGPLVPGNRECLPGEESPSAAMGYGLTIPVAMANDYNGYIATYREFQRGDHYRKALTAWGPHSSDYMASRLVHMARRLRQPAVVPPTDQVQEELLAAKAVLDTSVNEARAQALGTVGGAAVQAYENAIPDEGGQTRGIEQPQNVERFGAANFTWNGGSNFIDNPEVTVERLDGSDWVAYADQSGEVPVTLEFPEGTDSPSYLTGGHHWRWTAHFEAFVSSFDLGGPRATPAGTYRFFVSGERRSGGQTVPYELVSEDFEVTPWSGITAQDLRLEADRTLSFAVGPRTTYTVGGADPNVETQGGGPEIQAEIGPVDYPDTYESDVRFIDFKRTAFRDPAAPADPDQLEWYCFTCSFRPWLDAGDAETASVTIFDAEGNAGEVPATRDGDRWVTAATLAPGELAVVNEGDVLDEWENFNGAASNAVYGGDPPDPPPPPGRCEVTLPGTPLGDVLRGTGASELLSGFAGDDVARGRGGDDCLYGGDGFDVLRGGGGADRVNGEGDDDLIVGGSGDDRMRSWAGGVDIVRCGPGEDRATVGPRDDVHGCEHVRLLPA